MDIRVGGRMSRVEGNIREEVWGGGFLKIIIFFCFGFDDAGNKKLVNFRIGFRRIDWCY